LCVGKNPCATTLTINGNHPAILKFPISYARNPNDNFGGTDFCGIAGCSAVDRSTSTGHTFTKEWTEQERLWDSIKANCYFCCPEFVDDFGTEVPYLQSKIEGNGIRVASRCYKAMIRYMNLEVAIKQGRRTINGESVCGVDVLAKLTFKRYFEYAENVCEYRYAKITPFEVPCITVFPTPDLTPKERACSFCLPGGNSFTPNTDYSTQPFPTVPNCPTPSWGDNNPDSGINSNIPDNIYCIWRAKFVPNISSVSCKQEPFITSLGPQDNLLATSSCCGNSRNAPSDVYYSYQQLSNFDCGSFTNCRGTFNKGFEYGNWIGVSSGSGYPGFGDLTGSRLNCTNQDNNNAPLIPRCSNCEITFRNRGDNIIRPVPNNTLLFGEANDQWSLNILCSN
jgi:hypothetical protein